MVCALLLKCPFFVCIAADSNADDSVNQLNVIEGNTDDWRQGLARFDRQSAVAVTPQVVAVRVQHLHNSGQARPGLQQSPAAGSSSGSLYEELVSMQNALGNDEAAETAVIEASREEFERKREQREELRRERRQMNNINRNGFHGAQPQPFAPLTEMNIPAGPTNIQRVGEPAYLLPPPSPASTSRRDMPGHDPARSTVSMPSYPAQANGSHGIAAAGAIGRGEGSSARGGQAGGDDEMFLWCPGSGTNRYPNTQYTHNSGQSNSTSAQPDQPPALIPVQGRAPFAEQPAKHGQLAPYPGAHSEGIASVSLAGASDSSPSSNRRSDESCQRCEQLERNLRQQSLRFERELRQLTPPREAQQGNVSHASAVFSCSLPSTFSIFLFCYISVLLNSSDIVDFAVNFNFSIVFSQSALVDQCVQ